MMSGDGLREERIFLLENSDAINNRFNFSNAIRLMLKQGIPNVNAQSLIEEENLLEICRNTNGEVLQCYSSLCNEKLSGGYFIYVKDIAGRLQKTEEPNCSAFDG